MKVLVTGGAGFIGSNLVEHLLGMDEIEHVRILDNLETGYYDNIKEFEDNPKFQFIEGDIRDFVTCMDACKDIEIIFHQAALGSVPRSIDNPIDSTHTNVLGNVTLMFAAVKQGVRRFIYAASSSIYGDAPQEPLIEGKQGNLLSPYAVTKQAGVLFAKNFTKTYGLETIGLIYFNVFGPKQNIKGPYAAVIPLFITKLLKGEQPTIYGNGDESSRDFTYIDNVVHANILAMKTTNPKAIGNVYNASCGENTTLNELFTQLKELSGTDIQPIYTDLRDGDIQFSQANITNISNDLDYSPQIHVPEGLQKTFAWFKARHNKE